MKNAFITGITGQDGSYLADFLLEKGYKIWALVRFSSTPLCKTNMSHLINNPNIHVKFGDITDSQSVLRIIHEMVQSDPEGSYELYNLAAQSHVGISFDCPRATIETNITSILNILDAVVFLGIKERARVYQASTSEMFGKVQEVPQCETTPFHPRSPYGVSKLCGHWIVKNYRETYNLYACCGILFNHESPRRGANFVTQKIVQNALSNQKILELGNLDSQRDWGHARDYVEAMWLMLQQPEPNEFVVATGTMTTVRDFCTKVFEKVGTIIHWEGEGIDEIGLDCMNGEIRVRVNPNFYRPCEVEELKGNPKNIHSIGWSPTYDIDGLIDDMITSERGSPRPREILKQ